MPDEPTLPDPRGPPPPLSTGALRRELLRPDERPEIAGYEIREPLGEGGMGTVWRAVQKSTRREVALKLMSESRLGSDKIRQRFEREVELAARLEHPNIARVYDSGLDRGVYYYAMECVKGVPLDHFVEDRKLPRRAILQLMQKVCEAIQHAHRNGVIHRDLKFNNILVSEDGEPHVLDFGLAKPLDLDEKGMSLSLDGDVLGTPWFMSPEQASGKAREADTRSDVYSLGVMLYYLLTSVFPHDIRGSAWEVMKRVAEEEPQRPRAVDKSIDADLEALLLKALQREPGQRYENGGHLANDIANYLAGNPLMAQPATTMYFIKKRVRKYRIPLALGAAALVILIVLVTGFLIRVTVERNRTQAALADLRGTAPAIYEQALFLRDQNRLEDAFSAISTAMELKPDEPEYHLLAGHLCQIMLQFEEAASFYREGLRLAPGHARADENVKLSNRLAGLVQNTNNSSDEVVFELRNEFIFQKRYADIRALDRWINQHTERQDMPWGPKKFAALWDEKCRKIGMVNFNLSQNDSFGGGEYLGVGLIGLSLRDMSLTNLDPLARVPLGQLAVSGRNITDLLPIQQLPLKYLDVANTGVRDIRPLQGMSLITLDLSNTGVTDLSPLKEMHTLKALDISQTKITDLSPLRGLLLVQLIANETGISNLGPLAGMPLNTINITETRVADLSPLAGMPLTHLILAATPVSDLGPLAGMPLIVLHLPETDVVDLTPLKGMRLARLNLGGTKVRSADGLQGMPLTSLNLCNTQVQDLNALAGMPLEEINLANTPVVDLGPLSGLPLRKLFLQGCKQLHDLTPLTNCPTLQVLTLPPRHDSIDFLRQHPGLVSISYAGLGSEPKEEFWARYDAVAKARIDHPAMVPSDLAGTEQNTAKGAEIQQILSTAAHLHVQDYTPAADREALLDQYYAMISHYAYRWGDSGTALAAIVRAEFEQVCPPVMFTIIPYANYSQGDKRTLGNVSLIITEVVSRRVLLAAWVGYGARVESPRERLNRFRHYLAQGEALYFMPFGQYEKFIQASDFSDVTAYVLIGLQGARAAGFDYEVDITRAELEQLQQRLLQIPKEGK